MCCTPEQIVSNPNHNIEADVSTPNQHTQTHTLYLSSTQQTCLEVLTREECLYILQIGELSQTHVHKLHFPLNTGAFHAASREGHGCACFFKPTQKLYVQAPLIHNLLIFAFRRNPSHICKCMTIKNKLWHWWCAQSLKLNTQGGNECVWLTPTWSQFSTIASPEVSPHSLNNNPWR